MQCNKCGSDNVFFKSKGHGKRGPWELYACNNGCIKEETDKGYKESDAKYLGRTYTFFAEDNAKPKQKAETTGGLTKTDQLFQELRKVNEKLDKITVLLTDPLERVSREAQSSFGGQQVATQEEETPF